MRSILVLLFVFMTVVSFGQSKKKKPQQRPKADERTAPAPTSLDPNVQQTFEPNKERSRKSKKRKTSKGGSYSPEQDHADRVAALEKERRKTERMADKPQYSDPSYFGHKRPPKKRPPGKMKYCKECGLRH
jgi:hypothetical protein